MKPIERYLKSIVAPACDGDGMILEAFLKCPREKFVEEALQRIAYEDNAIPIGFGQTISKPSTVAYMTKLLNPTKEDIVLEIGTGSGFQCAVLSFLSKFVYTVERIPQLSYKASITLKKLHIKNVKFKVDNGQIGWQEYAPFDKIIVTASGDEIPQKLLDQLKIGGMMVMPIKDRIYVIEKLESDVNIKMGDECRFVEFVNS